MGLIVGPEPDGDGRFEVRPAAPAYRGQGHDRREYPEHGPDQYEPQHGRGQGLVQRGEGTLQSGDGSKTEEQKKERPGELAQSLDRVPSSGFRLRRGDIYVARLGRTAAASGAAQPGRAPPSARQAKAFLFETMPRPSHRQPLVDQQYVT